MGWFWTEKSSTPPVSAPHPVRDSSQSPPSACPMHNNTSALPTSFPSAASSTPSSSGCPVKPAQRSTALEAFAQGCPVQHNPPTSAPAPSPTPPPSGLFGKLNPLNYMPSLPQTRQADQLYALPTERERSSIPRGDDTGNWEYPSPQQMYNAMARKDRSRDDGGGVAGSRVPIDAVESMVAIHNFLNEGAWAEIEAWEARFSKGLGFGWRTCRSGEDGFVREYRAAAREGGFEEPMPPKLVRFMGRPGDLTPKARIFQALGMVAPRYAGDRPFDRHDWFVQRRERGGATREVRYVIDYYTGPPEEESGMPVFHLDVRPALDGPTAAVERMMRWGGDVWYRASGASTRE